MSSSLTPCLRALAAITRFTPTTTSYLAVGDLSSLPQPTQSTGPEGERWSARAAATLPLITASLTAGPVALPAGTTVGQRQLPRVGDRDLLAADTSALWAGLRRLWVPCARFNHGHQHIPGRLAISRALPINRGGLAAGASAGEARRCIGSVARDCPAVVMRRWRA